MSDGNPEIECSKVRKCKWKGDWSDLKKVPSKKYSECKIAVMDNVCPNCGNDSFYDIK